MFSIRRLWHSLIKIFRNNHDFLVFLKAIESIISKLLALLLLGVIFYAIYDLVWVLFTHFLQPLAEGVPFRNRLFEVFGLFLNILIALELLENITAYLKKHEIQLELVIITSLIAVARKIIIFDIDKKSTDNLIAMAVAVFMLSLSYLFIVSRTRYKDK
ncbi:phosphate-starvation-inducible PsiE family protein [Spirulina sp. CS-785/01]|uniref:phosphate-starvation-inducible PsiE family protein n=1 Tax=Spirulina sp. CS-785/01 TaxID=3021716 RepID=UPI00232E55B2|nr:phosphate-starvation-inducible PsiE family protein [Spirulina sp. CS-785/01]MDB9311846.1 phosphate-starvation-inducible PsiE family protein [Spirulina sp. CS-785/01]